MAILGERIPILRKCEGYSPTRGPPAEVLVHGLVSACRCEIKRACLLSSNVLIVRPSPPARAVKQDIFNSVTQAPAHGFAVKDCALVRAGAGGVDGGAHLTVAGGTRAR